MNKPSLWAGLALILISTFLVILGVILRLKSILSTGDGGVGLIILFLGLLLSLAFWVWMVIDALSIKRFKTPMKIFLVIMFLIFSPMAVIWFLLRAFGVVK